MPDKPIAEGLYRIEGGAAQLIGSRCGECGEVSFPSQDACPSCTTRGAEAIPLSRRGTLWTWTIQHFPPPPPYIGPADRETFEPYGVGYVELAEGIRVEGRLTESDPEKLSIGMEMELVLQPFVQDEEGNHRITFAFQPVDDPR
jgi:uncharacterized OB-fold protein